MKTETLLNRKSWLQRLQEFNEIAIDMAVSNAKDEDKKAFLAINESAYKDCLLELQCCHENPIVSNAKDITASITQN